MWNVWRTVEARPERAVILWMRTTDIFGKLKGIRNSGGI